ncbi:MAG: TIGR03986 family CRISPR-associated RAMP protein [Saprospiraceae bacterium]|nr:TIGR03986 family CRISPR-associated RAMP protein [Saprospiraceae bacterium]
MNWGTEYQIEFRGNRVTLRNIDDRSDWFDVSNFNLNKEEHDTCFVDEDDIEFKSIQTQRGDRTVISSLTVDGVQYRYRLKNATVKNQNKHNGTKGNSGNRNQSHGPRNQNQHQEKPSTGYSGAPYNFVPLNKIVVQTEKVTSHGSYDVTKKSGYIDYSIHSLTPLFIRGIDAEFFGPKGQKMIPGSSLRGMIRNMVEMLSFSKLEFTEKERLLYYRDVASGKDNYGSRINGKQKAGWVRLKGRKIELCKAQNVHNNHSFLPIKGRWEKNLWCTNKSKYTIGKFEKVKFSTYTGKKGELMAKLSQNTGQEAYLYITGKFANKKTRQYIIGQPDSSQVVDITESYSIYRDDDNRDIKYDLVKRLNKKDYKGIWLPVFYIEESMNTTPNSTKIYVIGDTLMFRLPYQKKIQSFIYKMHKDDSLTDMATALFGNLKHAGKVYFEDAKMTSGTEAQEEEHLNILNGPKPTTYQHYLKQNQNSQKKTYNSGDTVISGHKLYWHRAGAEYKADPIKRNKNAKPYPDPIKKVEKDSTFQGRIRFDNCSDAELGALLMALDLPKGCAHRIGLAKPFGFGSIQFERIDISIIDRIQRYSQLFDNNQWNSGISTQLSTKADFESLKLSFIQYLSSFDGLSFTSLEHFWSDPERIAHLKELLRFRPKDQEWLEKTRYMEIEKPMFNDDGTPTLFKGKPYKDNEYRLRPILKRPTEYLDS